MTNRILANYNNQELYLDEVQISPLDRAYLFGDAIYEVIRVYKGQAWLIDEHLTRMQHSLNAIKIASNTDDLKQNIVQLLKNSQILNGSIYIQISRGEAPRTHAFPIPTVKPNVLIWVQETDESKLKSFWEQGISVITYPDIRWARCDIKSVNLLGNCLAKQEAVAHDCYEAILINGRGDVTEATASNVFCIQSGVLITTPKGQDKLPGTTRECVLGLAKELGLTVQETQIAKEELFDFDEVFLSGTTTEIMPVVKIDEVVIGSGEPGEWTMKIQKMFFEKTRR